jgi:hypothetical protein
MASLTRAQRKVSPAVVDLSQAKSHKLVQDQRIEASEWGFVAATIVLVLALTSLPYLYAYATTPADKQYTGIMLDAPDYGQYFSWMRELAAAPLAANKLTPEPNRAIFFNLLWWGLGHVGRWTGLGFAAMLQVLRVTAGSLFLLSAYLLCSWFLADRRMRRVAFLTVAFTSGFGWVLVLLKYTVARGQLPLPLDLYIAEGNTFLDILAYPHFVGAALYIVVFYLVLLGETKAQLRYAIAGGLVALFLGWQHAYDLWAVYAVLAVYATLRTLRDRAIPIYLIQSGLVIGLISWWPALYSVVLTSADPMWKAVLAQFVNAGVFTPNLLQLPILLGPAFVLALLTAFKQNPFHLQGVSNKDLFIRGWFFVTFALIYLPVDYQIHLINGWQVPIAILATQGLFAYGMPLVQNWGKPSRRPLQQQQVERGLMIALIVCILPTNLYLLSWRFAELSRHDYPYFLNRDETAALAWLDSNVKPNDVVLSSLTIGQYVPAYTGAHAFLAHWAQTLDFFGKSQMVADFYSTSTSDQRRWQIMNQYGVTYVFDGPAERNLGSFGLHGAPFLRPVFTSPKVVVYQVQRP